jgi:hypothetical protein
MGGYVPPTTIPVVNTEPQPSEVTEEDAPVAAEPPSDSSAEPGSADSESVNPAEPLSPDTPSSPQP